MQCGCEATLRHLIWECKIWQDEPAPAHVLTLKTQAATQVTGAWEGGCTISDPDIRYATDGSPGGSQDARCGNLRWAAIAFKVKDEVVATAIGAVPCEQTVFRAEAMAALFVAKHTEVTSMSPWTAWVSKSKLKATKPAATQRTCLMAFALNRTASTCFGYAATLVMRSLSKSMVRANSGDGKPIGKLITSLDKRPTVDATSSMKRSLNSRTRMHMLPLPSFRNAFTAYSLKERRRDSKLSSGRKIELSAAPRKRPHKTSLSLVLTQSLILSKMIEGRKQNPWLPNIPFR